MLIEIEELRERIRQLEATIAKLQDMVDSCELMGYSWEGDGWVDLEELTANN